MTSTYLTYLDQQIGQLEGQLSGLRLARATYLEYEAAQSNAPNGEEVKTQDFTGRLPARGLPTSGRARDINETLNANPNGLTRVQLRGITGLSADDTNTVLDRGRKNETIEQRGEAFFLTALGRANLKRSKPYRGDLKSFKEDSSH